MARRAPAAAQALEVLHAIADRAEPISAASIAMRTGLARSTTYYLLDVLRDYGYVVHYPEHRTFGLGLAAHELGSAYRRQAPLRRLAQPILDALVDEAGESGHFAVLAGSDIVYLIEDRAPRGPALISEVGVRLPAHLTASGLALLARLPSAQVRALFPSKDAFFSRSGAGPSSLTDLRRTLVTVRRHGFAIERGLIMPGLASVAAAGSDRNGYPVGSFTLTYAEKEGTDTDGLGRRVMAAAARLSDRYQQQ